MATAAATVLFRELWYDVKRVTVDAATNRVFALAVYQPPSSTAQQRLIVIDVASGQHTVRQIAVSPTAPVYTPYYDSASNMVRTPYWDLALGRVGVEGVSLSSIVQERLERAGVAAEHISVELTDDPAVVGYQKATVMSTRDALGPLTSAYAFDVVDVAYGIKARTRGGPSVVTIHDDELLALEDTDEAVVEVVLAQDTELPAKVNLNYLDRTTDYAPGSQPAQRRLTTSQTVTSVELPVVFDGNSQPRAAADRLLAETRLAARTYKCVLPLDYLYLEPGDPWTLEYRDGSRREMLMQRVAFSYDALALLPCRQPTSAGCGPRSLYVSTNSQALWAGASRARRPSDDNDNELRHRTTRSTARCMRCSAGTRTLHA